MSHVRQVFCPNCGGGCPPDALTCHWCHRPLYQPPAAGTRQPRTPTMLWILAALFGLSFLVAIFWPRSFFARGEAYAILGVIFIVEAALHFTFAWGVLELKSWAWPLGMWLNAANILLAIVVYAEGYDMLITVVLSLVFICWLANANVRKALAQS